MEGLATTTVRRPSPAELTAAAGRTVPDVIGPGLRVLFCGINPGLWSGAVRHHFARPGNRFWKALAASGFTETVLSPYDDRQLLDVGVGITNLVRTATRSAAEVTSADLRRGVVNLERKVRRWHPRRRGRSRPRRLPDRLWAQERHNWLPTRPDRRGAAMGYPEPERYSGPLPV